MVFPILHDDSRTNPKQALNQTECTVFGAKTPNIATASRLAGRSPAYQPDALEGQTPTISNLKKVLNEATHTCANSRLFKCRCLN